MTALYSFLLLASPPLVHTLAAGARVLSGLHPNGLLEVRLGSPFQAMDVDQLDALERALEGSDDAGGDLGSPIQAILMITSSAEAQASRPAKLPQMSVDVRQRLASRERDLHAFLLEAAKEQPVIALGDGWHLSSSAAGLFMAASTRVCTDRTVLALPECRGGLSPGSGSLAYLSRLAPHMAMYVALTGAQLNSHDCMCLELATHYVCTADVLDLLNELRCAPAGYLDVPLSRRALPPPEGLASLFARDVHDLLDASLSKCFGGGVGSASEVRPVLQEERARLNSMLRSCGWHTRERAEAVLDVLDAAATALRRADDGAVAATFGAVRKTAAGALSEAAARELELAVNSELLGRLEAGVPNPNK